jgi:ABC-2 type transport system permease protein
MRNVYLIFRRDYLGYVRTPGASGSALLPCRLFMIIGRHAVAHSSPRKSSPVRYYTVVEPAESVLCRRH